MGLGKMGILHASLLNTIPGVQLVAFCEKKYLIRRFSKKVFKGIKVVSSVSELADFALDAVYVTTPPSAHFPVIRTIYSEGITNNVFVEKPLASDYSDSKELCILAKNGGINMVGYNRRFAVTFRKAREVLEEEGLGELISFEGYAYSSDLLGVRADSKNLPGDGVLKDLGCHAIDLALWFFKELSIERAEVKSTTGSHSEDSVYFEVKSPRGFNGKIKSSWCMEDYRLPEIGMLVNGSRGRMRVNDDSVELKLNSGKTHVWHRHDLGDNVGFFIGRSDYFREHEAFWKGITSGCEVEPDFGAALEIDRVIEQVRTKASENGR